MLVRMSKEPANLSLLRIAVAEHPEACIGTAPDGRVILELGPLGKTFAVQYGQALRWSGCERRSRGVWLVPAGLLEAPAVSDLEREFPNLPDSERARIEFMRSWAP